MPRLSARMLLLGPLIFLGCEDGENSSESGLPQFTIIEDTAEPDSSESPPITVEWLERSRPGRPVPAQVVFARLEGKGLGDGVRVEGMIRDTLTYIDIDEADPDAFPFRTTLLDGEGAVVWSESIREPIQVREFLANAGLVEMGINPYGIVPEVGDFIFKIPALLDTGLLRFERFDLDGSSTVLGEFPLDEIPEMPQPDFAGAPVTTIVGKTPPEEALDVVILGDGYTEAELGLFKAHAGKISTQFTKIAPYADYFSRINFYRIDVPSAESGASYDCSDKEEIEDCVDDFRDTAFGSVFPLRLGVLLGMEVSDRAIFQLKQWSLLQAAALAPYDEVVVLVNTRKFGAFGIYNSSVGAYLENLSRVTVHEMGHSFALLGDEYIVEGDICQGYELTPDYPNITPWQENPENIPWREWLTPNVPLPTPADGTYSEAVGMFKGAGAGCLDYYRPTEDCLMRSTSSGAPLCPICVEQTIRQFYRVFDVMKGEGMRLEGNTVVPDTFEGVDVEVAWSIDGEAAEAEEGILSLPVPEPGASIELDLQLRVRDRTPKVRTGKEFLWEEATARVRISRAAP